MPQVNIPDALFQEVEKALPNAVSPDDFVVMAVREKLTSEGQKKRVFQAIRPDSIGHDGARVFGV
ncbi:MAG: hypothetical protein KKE86_12900 [Planctomycetes bacterium]|nr:hypothetical protein [Planctomycetota bacterium]